MKGEAVLGETPGLAYQHISECDGEECIVWRKGVDGNGGDGGWMVAIVYGGRVGQGTCPGGVRP
eukprot:7725227-Pyramimonas_sp.AAC.1